ncbi:diphthamide biosynthesis protein [Methanocaldococcus villosus KIN24-T80]|uniref:2-(3-amino-3-carboxypropyl)histidine synthase n=1 Tax=Methanocaldococcus villosus KIN24-T80 TaxID=1069083 RepID=N6V300_9EURY|nr:diphthamide biosynthesis enzyme Dph2 [Methanocaldococcus villosus]ENN96613.1 diphthamide biosynthesis protein [Methanocaldococcus villosus KIN24-T80]
MYDLETERVIEEIKKLGKENPIVIFQAPEGLKLEVEKEIEKIKNKINITPFLWLNSCYGACDLIEDKVKIVNPDLIIHYGHKKLDYVNSEKTIFIPAYYKGDREKIIRDIKEFIKNREFNVITTVQFEKILEEFNPHVIIGCRVEVDSNKDLLFVGTGRFHPLMLAYKYKKDVFIYNPISYKFDKIGREEVEKFIRKRLSAVAKLKFMDIKKVGVVLSVKKGQCRKKKFYEIINLLEKNNINYLSILADEVKPELLFYDVDAYIIIACPRIVLDDYILYKKPIYTPEEFKMFLNSDFNYKLDEVREEDFEG